MNKRITSLLLCFLMVFSMLTTTAGHTHAVSKPTVSIEASVATAKPGDEVELTLYFQSPVDTIGGQVFVDLPEGLTYVSCDLDTNRYAALDVMDALGMIEGDVDWVAESMQMFFAGMAGYPLPNVADAPVALATIICKVDEDAAPGTYNIGISSTSADGTIVGGIGNGDGDMLAASAYDLVGTSITVEGAEPAGKPVVSMEANKETAKAGDEVEFTLYFQSSVDTIGGQVFVDLPEGLTYVSCNLDTDRYAALDVMDALGMIEGDVDWVAESMQMFFAGMAGYPLPNVADAPVALATIVCKVDEDAAPGTYNIGISSTSADGTIVGGIGNGDGDMLAASAYDLVGTSITVEGAEPAGKPTVSMKANKETVNAGEEVEFTLYFQSDVDTIGGQVFVDLPEGLTYVSCNLDTDRYAALDVMDALGMVEGDVDWVAESMQMFFAGMAGYPLPNVADAPVALATIVCKVDEDAAPGTYNIGISSTSADGTIVGGIGNGDGDMLADSKYDLVGTSIEVVGAAACNHEWSTTLVNTDPAGHYYECSKCGEKKDEKEHSATDDKDCTTADLCSCGYVVTAAGEHTPEADDGDCQTPVGCTKCDQTVVAAKTHVAAADDNDCTTPVYCTNEGCTQEVVPAEAAHVAGEDDGDCTTAVKCVNCDHICVEAKDAHVPGEDDGDCTTAVKCVNCDHICVEAKDAHVPGEDDGDCTTAVKCVNCDHICVEAKDAHVPGEDDGDCTTAVKCVNCDHICVEAKDAHVPGEDDGDCTTAVKCVNCDHICVEAKDAHVPGEDDGDCTTAVKCVNCDHICVEAKDAHVPGEDDGDCTTAVKCVNCDHICVEAKDAHVPGEDDGDCTTAVKCVNCDHICVEAKDAHVPGEDDGDCTTAVKCVNCDKNAIEAKDAHVAGEDDGDCSTAVKCINCEKNAIEAGEHNPGEDDGDCTTAVKCVNCDHICVEAKDAHVPGEDDGDCTTAVKCVNCDHICVEAKDAHVAGEDDGDCTTAVKCVNCDHICVEAKDAHVPGEDDGDCTTAVKCVNCDHICVEAKDAHVPGEDDGDCTTAVKCVNCDHICVEAKDAHVPGEDDGDCTTAVKCVNCDHICVEAKDAHVPGEDDGDCTTAVKCVNCDHICVEAKDAHVPGEDDGDCTTAVKCVNCDQNAIEAKDAHVAEEDDGDCSTAVKCANCDQIVVEAKNHDFSGDWHDDKAEGHYHSCGNEGCEATDEIVEHIPGPPATPAEPQVCTECGYVLAEATNQFVNSVEATVTKPVIGKTPDYNVTIKSNPAGKAELNRIVWYKIAEADYTGTNEDSWTTVDPDEVFEAGYVYSCDIYLDTVDGYWVAEDITGKVNGKAHDDSYGGVYGSETEIYLAQDFKPIDPSNPQTGDNSNMTLWIAMLVLSGAGVIGAFVYDRKKKRV